MTRLNALQNCVEKPWCTWFVSIWFLWVYVSMFVVFLPVPVFYMTTDVTDQIRATHAQRHWRVGDKTRCLI